MAIRIVSINTATLLLSTFVVVELLVVEVQSITILVSINLVEDEFTSDDDFESSFLLLSLLIERSRGLLRNRRPLPLPLSLILLMIRCKLDFKIFLF